MPWRSEHTRHSLVAGAFGVAHGPKEVIALRLALQRACARFDDERVCKFHRLGASPDGGPRLGASHDGAKSAAVVHEPGWHSISRLYWNATFCLQPPGDAVSRKAIIDSLVLGCIPVLFHRGQAEQWPWHWGTWGHDASVLIDMDAILKKRVDPIEALQAIPPAQVARMRRVLAANVHVMQYSAVDTAALPTALTSGVRRGGRLAQHGAQHGVFHDAFDVALGHAWARADDALAVEGGWHMQQANGAALDAALDLFDREPRTGSWGGPNTGSCMRTWGGPGDCARSGAGTWGVGVDGMWSLDDCAERCRRCARCQWVSLSHAHQQCDWYNTCNTSKLRRNFGAETFKTRRVKL